MLIEDLPCLDDDDREALDIGYVAIAGVPTGDEPGLTPPKPARFPRLRNVFAAVITALGLTACSTTQQIAAWPIWAKWTLVVLGLIGVIAVLWYNATVDLDPSEREESMSDE